MKINRVLFCLTAAAVLAAGCKSEKDGDRTTDADYSSIVLNEVCGAGPVDEDPKGESDWIEIYNTGTQAVNLAGVKVEKTDEEGLTETVYTFPAFSEIEAGAYLVLTYPDILSSKISNKKPLKIALLSPSGEAIDDFDRDARIEEGSGIADSFGNNKGHNPGGSYARIPDGGSEWKVTATSTKGASNVYAEAPKEDDKGGSYDGLSLNEVNGNDKFIELYNASDKALDIVGIQIRKDGDNIVWIAPEGTKIPAKGFLTLNGNAADFSAGFTSGLSADKSVKIELLNSAGEEIDVFKNLSESKGESWGEKDGKYDAKSSGLSFGRYPDGTGKWYLATATKDASNVKGDTEIVW